MKNTRLFLSFFIAYTPLIACGESAFETRRTMHAATQTPSSVPCPSPQNVNTSHLYGLWRVQFFDGILPADDRAEPGRAATAHTTVLFERHPEHTDSVRGAMKPLGTSATTAGAAGTYWLSGDLDEGELILDESDNGQRISAVWVAHPTVSGCGKVFRGHRRLADSDSGQSFIMTKAAGWQ